MPKLIVAGVLVAAGLVVIASQAFREDPSVPVFFGGLLLAIFGGIAFSDGKADE